MTNNFLSAFKTIKIRNGEKMHFMKKYERQKIKTYNDSKSQLLQSHGIRHKINLPFQFM